MWILLFNLWYFALETNTDNFQLPYPSHAKIASFLAYQLSDCGSTVPQNNTLKFHLCKCLTTQSWYILNLFQLHSCLPWWSSRQNTTHWRHTVCLFIFCYTFPFSILIKVSSFTAAVAKTRMIHSSINKCSMWLRVPTKLVIFQFFQLKKFCLHL